MIKRIIHIDQNFPRRLNEQDSLHTISDTNWGLNTVGQTLNGEILEESPQKKTNANIDNSINVDQAFDDENLSSRQLSKLEQDKQIRFNANVFNYIVHTELSNVILKYDSPVVYAEGKEDTYTGIFTWKEKYLVLDGYDYHILFDILMHDPIGVDAYSYEAYVRNTLFGQVNRKNKTVNNVSPVEHVSYAIFTNENTAISGQEDSDRPTSGSWITVHSTAKSGVSQEHFKISKLIDTYSGKDDIESVFKVSVQLSGQGYDDKYINTDDSLFKRWTDVISNLDSTEQQIVDAWKACNGVKFKFFDVAGNVTYWVMPKIKIEVVTLDELYHMKKLILEFVNTRPSDLFLGSDLIGRTTVKVTNQNSKLVSYPIIVSLDKESIGQLYRNTYKEHYLKDNSLNSIAKISTEDVGNIAESGWVIVHAVVDVDDFVDELEFARIMIQNLLRADGSLGEWIKECDDNVRKIMLDPFVPQYLRETTDKNNAYYMFVKFTEKYLNTMYKAYGKNCYISILEAIARIGNFNDCLQIYESLLNKYDNDHGDMMHIDANELALLIDVQRQEAEDET